MTWFINQNLVLKTNITFVQIDEGGNPIPLGEKAKRRLMSMIEDVNEKA